MIKTNQYRGFDEYFKISDFDSETQVFAEQSLLNDEEKASQRNAEMVGTEC